MIVTRITWYKMISDMSQHMCLRPHMITHEPSADSIVCQHVQGRSVANICTSPFTHSVRCEPPSMFQHQNFHRCKGTDASLPPPRQRKHKIVQLKVFVGSIVWGNGKEKYCVLYSIWNHIYIARTQNDLITAIQCRQHGRTPKYSVSTRCGRHNFLGYCRESCPTRRAEDCTCKETSACSVWNASMVFDQEN